MLINELLTLMDREVDLLTADNNHSAAALMAAGAARIRILARTIDQRSSADVERCSHGIAKDDCAACEPLARMRHK